VSAVEIPASVQEKLQQPPHRPPPMQPPPPRLPQGWRAVWNEDQQAHYFWHVASNHVTWDPPAGTENDSSNLQDSQRQQQAAPVAKQPLQHESPSTISHDQAAPDEDEGRKAAQLAAEQKFAARRAAAEEQQRLAEQRNAEQQAANERAAQVENIKKENLVVEAAHITGVPASQCRCRLVAEGWDLENAVKMLVAEQEQNRRRLELSNQVDARAEEADSAPRSAIASQASANPPANSSNGDGCGGSSQDQAMCLERICTRHWRPLANVPNTIRLLHGERVQVTWVQGEADGWAWGRCLEDSSREGYFPWDVVAALTHKPRYRPVGEVCAVSDIFEAPQEIGGYLSICPGDMVQVMHPLEEPFVWAYVKRIPQPRGTHRHDDGAASVGWIPECVLLTLDAHPAG